MVTGDKLLAGWLFNPHTNTWSTLDPPGAVTNCAVSMTAQAGALVALCTVDTVPVAVLRLPGETTWRSYPLPSGITASPNVVWTGKRLFIWGGAFPPTTMCPPPTPETAPMPSARASALPPAGEGRPTSASAWCAFRRSPSTALSDAVAMPRYERQPANDPRAGP